MITIDIDDIDTNNNSSTIFYNNDLPIPVLNNETEYNMFFTKYLLTNSPCILQDVSTPWLCNEKWINDQGIHFEYLKNEYGDLTAPVADCNTIQFNSHCKKNMKVGEYVDYLRNKSNEILYLKDWHLRRLKPDDNFYEVPKYFASDWLNEYSLDHQEDDFMFVYMGPAGSWTPFHADVYSSYSWSVNVIGLKKWIILPPGEENKLKDSLGNLPLQFKPEDHTDVFYYEVEQTKGEAVFVPSGWHHQVTNVQDTISINHNWINGCNVKMVWNALESQLKDVEHEIEEFKTSPEFTTDCQKMLKSLFGMDYTSFVNLLIHTAEKRIQQLQGCKHWQFNKFVFGKKHNIFDLQCIQNIFNIITNEIKHYEKYLTPNIIEKVYNLQSHIIKFIDT